MAHEIVRFRKKHKLFHLAPLEIAAALTAHWGLEQLSDKDPSQARIRAMFEGWLESLRTTNAFLNLELDEHLLTDSDTLRLVSLLDEASARARALGPEVPAELLNEILRIQGVGSFEQGVPSTVVQQIFTDLRDLVLHQSA